MQLSDRSWASGLFEGEGCFYTVNRKNSSTPSASLMTTDEDVIRRFNTALGMGNVCGPYQYPKNKKQFWTWSVTGFEHTQHVVATLWNNLGRRRKDRAKEILGIAKLTPVKPSQRMFCPQGHPYNTDNTSFVTRRSGPRSGSKHRVCKVCATAQTNAYRAPRYDQESAA